MNNKHIGLVAVALLLIGAVYGGFPHAVGLVFAEYKTIAQINALGKEPTWWERLIIEDAPPLVVLYALLTIPTWVASVLARSTSWYAGGVIGAIVGILVGNVLSSYTIAFFGAATLAALGCLFDFVISGHYQERIAAELHPKWWAGGKHGGKVWKHFT